MNGGQLLVLQDFWTSDQCGPSLSPTCQCDCEHLREGWRCVAFPKPILQRAFEFKEWYYKSPAPKNIINIDLAVRRSMLPISHYCSIHFDWRHRDTAWVLPSSTIHIPIRTPVSRTWQEASWQEILGSVICRLPASSNTSKNTEGASNKQH